MPQDKASEEKSAPAEQVRNTVSHLERCRRYVEDIRLEMTKASWPSWEQVRSSTFVVLFFTFAMTAFLKVIDVLVAFLYRLVVGR